VIAGFDACDPQSSNVPVPSYGESKHDLDGVRLGIIQDFSLENLQPDVETAIRAALDLCSANGAIVHAVKLPHLELSPSALLTIDICEPAAYHRTWLRERPTDYGEDVRTFLEAGDLYSASHYINAQRYRVILRDGLREALRDVDVLIAPTAPYVAPLIDATETELLTGETIDIVTGAVRYNALASLAGVPALSVPCGFSRDGLPIGMQIIGRAFDEEMVIAIGEAYQRLTDWHRQEPPIVNESLSSRDQIEGERGADAQ
jgi:aspartyl-tRNA(Asn)/glutamyl-tRNA(Gln) amidotransferase subunit A